MIPAKVNMPEGLVEYALVMEKGKAHESIFTTRATAEHIHIACMLLGMREARQAAGEAVPDADAVKVEVAWDSNGPEKRRPLSDCVALSEGSPDRVTGKLPAGPWFYGGCQIDAGGFAATREGSIISVISDSTALIINPHKDRENDNIHSHPETLMKTSWPLPARPLATSQRRSKLYCRASSSLLSAHSLEEATVDSPGRSPGLPIRRVRALKGRPHRRLRPFRATSPDSDDPGRCPTAV